MNTGDREEQGSWGWGKRIAGQGDSAHLPVVQVVIEALRFAVAGPNQRPRVEEEDVCEECLSRTLAPSGLQAQFYSYNNTACTRSQL